MESLHHTAIGQDTSRTGTLRAEATARDETQIPSRHSRPRWHGPFPAGDKSRPHFRSRQRSGRRCHWRRRHRSCCVHIWLGKRRFPVEAAHIANIAGGLVVMKRGTATVSRKELLEAIRKAASGVPCAILCGSAESKIQSRECCPLRCRELPAPGQAHRLCQRLLRYAPRWPRPLSFRRQARRRRPGRGRECRFQRLSV